MSKKKHITFIVNPISGNHHKDDIPQMIAEGIDSERFDVEIQFTEYRGHATQITQECVEKKVDVVVAVGGDGTINEVARSLTHSDTALGIIPYGSGNGLARHLCIPMNIRKAIDIINQCQIEAFDYGIINNIPFFCTCGMGFDAFISLKFAEAGKRGPITYVENVLMEGLKYQPETYEVEDSTGTHRYKAFLIACANASQYGNNAYIAPKASMKDGMMDVIIMEPFTTLEAPQISIDLFNKTLPSNSKIKTFKAQNIRIHRSKPGAIHYDGDPAMAEQNIEVMIKPLGIKIVTNPETMEDASQPNPLLNAFSVFFNNINNVYGDIEKGGRKIQAINKLMLHKLSKL